jgi:hypothetical protein
MTMTQDASLTPYRAHLSKSIGRSARSLLESSDLAAEVATLEPLEAYFIVKEVGVDEAAEILLACSPEQFQSFIDLDCWHDNEPAHLEIDAWLAPVAHQRPDILESVFLKLDEEVQVLFLKASLHIFTPDEADVLPDPPKGVVRKTTPDGYYVVESQHDLDREIDPLVFVDAIYHSGVERGFELLTAARWEVQSPLEEQALQFRSARVEALGFPSRDKSLSLFLKPNKTATTQNLITKDITTHQSLPSIYAGPLSQHCLLTAGLEHLESKSLSRIETQLQYLINHVVIAYEGSPKNVHGVSRCANLCRDILSLGLESLVNQGDPALELTRHIAIQASQYLEKDSLFDIFRHGYQEIHSLHLEAKSLAQDSVVKAWLATSVQEDEDYSQATMDRSFLLALGSFPPTYAGFDPITPNKSRAFASMTELLDSEERLRQIKSKYAA